MSYQDQIDALQAKGFHAKVMMAMLDQAQAVYIENPETENHGKRLRLVAKVVTDPKGWTQRVAPLVAAGDVTVASADSAFKARVADVWNALAEGAGR